MIGKFAKSKAGHDKDRIYVIVSEDAEYVYLADGRIRTAATPKKKKKKHIQPILTDSGALTAKLKAGQPVTDEEIKAAIKNGFDGK
ncbi:MAG: KOW domain-containing RNA-binding protein [Lachnospiraceae bacterium]|nr:KOW domain-containing RNA-binding protein [Lachnospiraceae bacterium]